MPMIGARFYTQLDTALLWGDMIEGEVEKVRKSHFSNIQSFDVLGNRKRAIAATAV